MTKLHAASRFDSVDYLTQFIHIEKGNLFSNGSSTMVDEVNIGDLPVKRFTNEFWTAKQRQANSLHEISYRACFKPQLPRFFIELLTAPGDIVYDPFTGRGTTIVEAALLGRNVISNDINPLSSILCKSRLFVPDLNELAARLNSIRIHKALSSDFDLAMFYHEDTLKEILSIRNYLIDRDETGKQDELDMWIRMVATNRLTGHSKGFFSVYTFPPNQAVSRDSQIRINQQRKQTPEYRDTKKLIIAKTKDLLKNVTQTDIVTLRRIGEKAIFLNDDARETKTIKRGVVSLTVTSPPFLDIVKYAADNWMRCWFNNIDAESVGLRITMSKKIEDWVDVMNGVFRELYRITKKEGFVAFEVGEVRNGKVKLDEYVAQIGINQGFSCEGIMINAQVFTKTSNIWGVSNNGKGTNTNRIVIFKKVL
ncbi:MAG: site-specific DNA-methyltransferase [Nitrospirae bacterium]|nr:site-specific DNA-methyltransferase [Nitrospirota bacterium]